MDKIYDEDEEALTTINKEVPVDLTRCACYGCTVKRIRAGIAAPDRSADPCEPPEACAKHGQCWTHSEWTDETVEGSKP